jgi:hypothetical protein
MEFAKGIGNGIAVGCIISGYIHIELAGLMVTGLGWFLYIINY